MGTLLDYIYLNINNLKLIITNCKSIFNKFANRDMIIILNFI